MAPPKGLLGHPGPVKGRSRALPRRIDPDDVPYTFDYEELFHSFTVEEHLQFAIAFKHHTKVFQLIAQEIDGRNEEECLMHYYSVKHDGRFKTRTWDETNIKHERQKYAALPEGDRRMEGISSTDGMVEKPSNNKQRQALHRLMKRVPLDQEIDRLLKLVPGASTTYAGALAAAQKAQDERTSDTIAHEFGRRMQSSSRPQGKSDVDVTEHIEKLRDDLDWIASKVHSSLEELLSAHEAFVVAKTGHAADPEDIHVELAMRVGEKYHGLWRLRVVWFHSALHAILDPDSEVEKPVHKLHCEKLWNMFVSMQDNFMKLDKHRRSIKKRLSVLCKQKHPKPDEITAAEATLADRDAELLQLKNEVQQLQTAISQVLGDHFADVGEDEEHMIQENDEQVGDEAEEDDLSEGEDDDDMDYDYED